MKTKSAVAAFSGEIMKALSVASAKWRRKQWQPRRYQSAKASLVASAKIMKMKMAAKAYGESVWREKRSVTAAS